MKSDLRQKGRHVYDTKLGLLLLREESVESRGKQRMQALEKKMSRMRPMRMT